MMDANKFSLAQATSNNSGKTSGSGTAGLYLVFIGGLIGMISSISALFSAPHISDTLLFATGIITTGAALLGYRKSVDKVEIENNVLNKEVK